VTFLILQFTHCFNFEVLFFLRQNKSMELWTEGNALQEM